MPLNVPKQADLSHHVAGHFAPPLGLIDGLIRTFSAKQGWVRLGLCPRHMNELRRQARAGTFLIALGLTLVILAFVFEDFNGLFGFAIALVGFCLGMSSAKPVSAVRIERGWIWIQGVTGEFLESLPTLDAPPEVVESASQDAPL